jgi:hypothetical protein
MLSVIMLNVTCKPFMLKCRYAECRNAECRYADCYATPKKDFQKGRKMFIPDFKI